MRPSIASSIALALALTACSASGPEPPAPPPPVAAAPPPPVAPPPPAPPPAPTATAVAVAPQSPSPPSPCPPNMALVPGGAYTMSPPKRAVTVAPFCMDLSETTADGYAACVKSGKCTADNLKCAEQATYEAPGMGDHPVVCVDFEQAVSYCKAQNKRLASDEEWEWAARGASAGTAYPWGNDKPSGKACWSGDAPLTGTCAVGAHTAGDSPQGIHDLAGNVFEWTTSRIDKKGLDRVGRGGSWRDGVPEALKASRPGGFKVTYRCGFLGIRCVVEPTKTPSP